MLKKMLKKTLMTLSGVVVAGVLSLSASAANAEVNFEGETVTIIIPFKEGGGTSCLLYTSPSPRDGLLSRMPSSA